MMRKKTLAAFAAVYAGICLTYGAVNGINLPASEAAEAAAETLPATETAAAPETAVPDTTEPETTEPLTEASRRRKHRRENRDAGEQPAYRQAEEPTESVTATPTEPDTEPDTQYIEETTQAPDVPTLEEYLKKKRCGGCGHGCSLANPRCMQGARKQSAAIDEYNAQYGG